MTYRSHLLTLTILALAGATTFAQEASLNFSSIETALVDPDDDNSMMTALWTGWTTELYEHNMPFISLTNDPSSTEPITQLTLSIGDTRYEFSNEFEHKEWTNSYPYSADGSYAVTGFSTPDVSFDSYILDGGDTLLLNFDDGGLQPGEVVRFQVDINRDSADEGALIYADYTQVFFNNGDTTPNMEISISFGDDELAPKAYATVGDQAGTTDVQSPRPYGEKQMIPIFPETEVVVPEPTAGVLAMLASLMALRAPRR